MSAAIGISDLGKRYHIGAERQRAGTLRDAVTNAVAAPIRRLRHAGSSTGNVTEFWALRNVSLEVEAGQVIGVIGRNGAGKSTLLKILSRITEPTEGRVTLNGRVGSLLEVGTGFHPELSGRENIYLNGAILGMTRAEIRRKFDDIVEFSEIGRFPDTPVKRYSSGMYVRLAFAVAAHLDPEILLVDEVLSVGDAEFQKKCLGKMSDVAQGGRTVVFVSHNMASVSRLCTTGLLLDGGRVKALGDVHEIVAEYLYGGGRGYAERHWPDGDLAPGDSVARLNSMRILQDGVQSGSVDISRPVTVEMVYTCMLDGSFLMPAFTFFNDEGQILFVAADFGRAVKGAEHRVGRHLCRCEVPGNLLTEGTLFVTPEVSTSRPTYQIHALVRDAVSFHVTEADADSGVRQGWGRDIPGVVRPSTRWEQEYLGQGGVL